MSPIQSLRLASQYVRGYCQASVRATELVFTKAKELRDNTDVFQKTCQVAFAIIQLILLQRPYLSTSLSRLSFTLETANMHDFYSFLKQGKQWFFPVNVDTLNAPKLVKSLTYALCDTFEEDPLQEDTYAVCSLVAERSLKNHLEWMAQKNKDYRSVNQFKKELFKGLYQEARLFNEAQAAEAPRGESLITASNQLLANLLAFIEEPVEEALVPLTTENEQIAENNGGAEAEANEAVDSEEETEADATLASLAGDPIAEGQAAAEVVGVRLGQANEDLRINSLIAANVNNILPQFEVSLRSTPLAEKITNLIFGFVDVGCVGLYLNTWNLLDTAKWANRIGQYQGFKWVKNQSLEYWVRGLVCGAYVFKLFEAVRLIRDEKLTNYDRNKAKWTVVTSTAELIFNGAGFAHRLGVLKVTAPFVYFSAIVAKSLGILSIVCRPKPDYFERPIRLQAS